ncbi:MAG: hypothetical protein NT145_08435, partial [Elusimicrobia bacterium]|nr:hypothetical protein [Elusimicrobiota bacterium]
MKKQFVKYLGVLAVSLGIVFSISQNEAMAGALIAVSSVSYASVGEDYAHGVAIDASGNILVEGQSQNDYLTIKYSPNLSQVISSVKYNGAYDDYGCSIVTDKANNIIVSGLKIGTTNTFLTIKYNSDLTQAVSSAAFTTGNYVEYDDVAVDASDNIIVTGYTYNGSNKDFFTVKYDSSLAVISSTTYDSGQDEYPTRVAVDKYNNIIVTGSKMNPAFHWDFFTIKYSSNLSQVISSATYDSGNSDSDESFGVAVDSSDNIVVTGYRKNVSDLFTIKYSSNLTQVISSATYYCANDISGNGVAIDGFGNIIVTGYINNEDKLNIIKVDPFIKIKSITGDSYTNNQPLKWDVSSDFPLT